MSQRLSPAPQMSVLTVSCTIKASEGHCLKGQFLWDGAHEGNRVKQIKTQLVFQNINDCGGPGRHRATGEFYQLYV